MIICGDALTELRKLPNESVNCCITSPPYWGLRDYGVKGQLDLERTLEEYIGKLAEVFHEVRRIFRKDGTLWLNLGDCYHSGDRGGYHRERAGVKKNMGHAGNYNDFIGAPNRRKQEGLKDKDLIGVPWAVAFALRADGWWLRQDIIWAKPNPMPESVRDRCTRAHEYVFMLAKSIKYYYDQESIRESANSEGPRGDSFLNDTGWEINAHGKERWKGERKLDWAENGRNRRSVWTISTKPFSDAHFATFPPDLVEPMIKAGCPPEGTVLDPFFGAGTTGLVAKQLGREFIGIELNPTYIKMAERRIAQVGYQTEIST